MTAKVYSAIASVSAALASEGISKGRKNVQQGYSFRGIDDVYNALAPILAKHGLCILPRVINREQVERQTKSGTPLFYTTVDVEFDFVAAEDGSTHTVRVAGEAMDSADKSTNKAMSAAYKYAAMQAFCIPTEGDNDADASHHEVAPSQQNRRDDPPAEPASGWAGWANDLIGKVNVAKSDKELDGLRDVEKRYIAGARTAEPTIYEAIGNAFQARRTALKTPMKEAA